MNSRRIKQSKIKKFSPRARLYLSAVLALPFIIGGMLLAQAEWLDPPGDPPPVGANLPGAVLLQTVDVQVGGIKISGPAFIEDGNLTLGKTVAAAWVGKKITAGQGDFTTTLGDAVLGLTTTPGSAAIKGIGIGNPTANPADPTATWAGYFDGTVFAKDVCVGANANSCQSLGSGSGSSGDLWEEVTAGGNNIRKKKAGVVVVGTSNSTIPATLSSDITDNLKLFLTGDSNRAPRVYLTSDTNNNPEIDLQLSAADKDHWGIFADKTSRNLNLWAKDKATAVDGGNRFSFTSDGVMIFGGWPAPTYGVTVIKTGSAANIGVVTSSELGINCGNTCSGANFPNYSVTLVANENGNKFNKWTNGTGPALFCSTGINSTNPSCSFTLSDNATVKADFSLIYKITLFKSGNNFDNVISSPSGINCGATCESTYNADTLVTLTAKPDVGCSNKCGSGGLRPPRDFCKWIGCPVGSYTMNTKSCTVTVDQALNITAEFMAQGGLCLPPDVGGGT